MRLRRSLACGASCGTERRDTKALVSAIPTSRGEFGPARRFIACGVSKGDLRGRIDEDCTDSGASYLSCLLARHLCQPAAKSDGAGVCLAISRIAGGPRERRPAQGGGFRQCRGRVLPESFRLPRETRGPDRHTPGPDWLGGMA